MHKHKHKLDTLRLNLAAFQKDILCLGSHAMPGQTFAELINKCFRFSIKLNYRDG